RSLLTMRRPPPCFTLFPYTTLFRSGADVREHGFEQLERVDAPEPQRPAVEVCEDHVGLAARPEALGEREAHFPLEPGRVEHASRDRKSTRLNSSHVKISYAVFCLKK